MEDIKDLDTGFPGIALEAKPPKMSCSFCGKSEGEVRVLVAGPIPVAICNECIELAVEVIREDFDPAFLKPSV